MNGNPNNQLNGGPPLIPNGQIKQGANPRLPAQVQQLPDPRARRNPPPVPVLSDNPPVPFSSLNPPVPVLPNVLPVLTSDQVDLRLFGQPAPPPQSVQPIPPVPLLSTQPPVNHYPPAPTLSARLRLRLPTVYNPPPVPPPPQPEQNKYFHFGT